ncbi:MAG: hypothetical protein IT460_07110 [Planctomycetes bacterium]|nr:hypothetical protein [Planctomycetota bacterium]
MEPRPSRPRWQRVLLGTAPGLEGVLLGLLPAIVVGGALATLVSRPLGIAVGAAIFVVGVLAARRAGGGPDDAPPAG